MDDNKKTTDTPNEAVSSLFQIENLIKTHISHIDTVKLEMSKQVEMFNDILANDPEYKKAADEGKEVNKKKGRSQTKCSQISQQCFIKSKNQRYASRDQGTKKRSE